jgi:hypothetical protein
MPFLRSGKQVESRADIPTRNRKKEKLEVVEENKEETKEKVDLVEAVEVKNTEKTEAEEEKIDAIVIDTPFGFDSASKTYVVEKKVESLAHPKAYQNCMIC